MQSIVVSSLAVCTDGVFGSRNWIEAICELEREMEGQFDRWPEAIFGRKADDTCLL